MAEHQDMTPGIIVRPTSRSSALIIRRRGRHRRDASGSMGVADLPSSGRTSRSTTSRTTCDSGLD